MFQHDSQVRPQYVNQGSQYFNTNELKNKNFYHHVVQLPDKKDIMPFYSTNYKRIKTASEMIPMN